MNEDPKAARTGADPAVSLPEGLTRPERAYKIIRLRADGMSMESAENQARAGRAMAAALRMAHPGPLSGQALIKVHVGEPACETRMKPGCAAGSVQFLLAAGAKAVVAGDTTVAYSGPRGHKQNPERDVSAYLDLAGRHGWSADGPAGVPFVVLDRPASAPRGRFEFKEEAQRIELGGISRFSDFFPAGGFAAADFIINHAHLTLHGLAGLAGCVKSIAMGCSAMTGKLRMHQSLLPAFDESLCVACGECVDNCPEAALVLDEGAASPEADPDKCIGCGECEAMCENGAVSLAGHEIICWERGAGTLGPRMADYAIGLMNGKWERTVHVLHMYSVTRRCDCVDKCQKPMLARDLGFLVGKNPFAVDCLAGKMLEQALREEGQEPARELAAAWQSAQYVREAYGILSDPPVVDLSIRELGGTAA